MKTITVREAAQALGLTKRAVMYRLEGGKLKGIRVKNDFGVEEWRIYPTKEIIEALNRAVSANPTSEPVGAPPTQHVDVEDVDFMEADAEDIGQTWQDSQREQLKMMAEELIRPLVEKFDAQTRQLVMKEREIDELKIKLLPDLQKRAEEERKAAETKELEIIALRRQIEAVKEAEAKEAEMLKARTEALEAEIPELREQLELQAAAKAELEAELVNLKTAAKRAAALENELELAKRPWWKKMFTPGPMPEETNAKA